MIPIRRGKPLEMLRRAAALARDILIETGEFIDPGKTTKEIDEFAADLIQTSGATSAFLNYRGFPGHICISVNEEIIHGIGSDRVIQSGDVVKIDVGIKKEGWVGDNAISVPVGEIPLATERLLFATEEALAQAVTYARDGGLLADLCGAVEDTAVQYGYSVVREFVGHGVGRKLHEEPQVPNYRPEGEKKVRLREGMVLAIEPMINLGTEEFKILGDKWTVVTKDRKPSAHFEHMVLVTRHGGEILTSRERLIAPGKHFPGPSVEKICP